MPQVDPLMGGRYWPAVRAFFDRRHGVTDRAVPSKPDEPEKFRCPSPVSQQRQLPDTRRERKTVGMFDALDEQNARRAAH
jgi:hypothetical protein